LPFCPFAAKLDKKLYLCYGEITDNYAQPQEGAFIMLKIHAAKDYSPSGKGRNNASTYI